MERPETQIAWSGPNALAYQVLGDGEPDLLYMDGFVSNVELNWDLPAKTRFLHGLARSRRLVMMDPRGVGCSERATPDEIWPLETVMEDVRIVLDAVGSERATIMATDQLGFVACMFAATYPERTAALILYQGTSNFLWSEETPWEWTAQDFEERAARWREQPLSRSRAREAVRSGDPSVADDPEYISWFYRYMLLSESWGSVIAASNKYMHTDIRPILPSIHVPVLVLARPDGPDEAFVESARFLASRIPGASLGLLPGRDMSLWVGDQASVHRAVDVFLGDVRREASELQRVLATVLFTDIVGSTEKASEVGDAGWRDLVERHHAAVRALIGRFRGREVDTAGDGFYATFDGPARAIRCARAIVEEVRPLGIEVRAGLHTGECEIIDGKVGGMAVNIGSRVTSAAHPSEVLVSQTVKDLVVGSGLEFEDRGEHALKGVDGTWRLYAVVG